MAGQSFGNRGVLSVPGHSLQDRSALAPTFGRCWSNSDKECCSAANDVNVPSAPDQLCSRCGFFTPTTDNRRCCRHGWNARYCAAGRQRWSRPRAPDRYFNCAYSLTGAEFAASRHEARGGDLQSGCKAELAHQLPVELRSHIEQNFVRGFSGHRLFDMNAARLARRKYPKLS